METLKDLINAVQRLLGTCELCGDDVTKMLNRQQLLIAGGGERQYGIPMLPPLPDLHDIFRVRVYPGRNEAILPSLYHRGDGDLVWEKETGKHIDTVDTLKTFYKKNSNKLGKTGELYRCCFVGRKIHYVNSPVSEIDLQFTGYRLPQEMVNNDDTPDGIPEHLQYPLLVNGTVYVYYNFIDQDQSKPLHNIEKHRFFFQQALTDLQVWIQNHDGAYNMEEDVSNFQ